MNNERNAYLYWIMHLTLLLQLYCKISDKFVKIQFKYSFIKLFLFLLVKSKRELS